MAEQDGAQVDQQRALRLQREAVAALLAAHQQARGRGVDGSTSGSRERMRSGATAGSRSQGESSTLSSWTSPALSASDPAARQGKGAVHGGVAQRDRQVGVVKGQLGEGAGEAGEERRLLGCLLHLDRQHAERLSGDQLAALLPAQLHLDGLRLQVAPQLAQAPGGSGGVEGDREGLAQAAPAAILVQQPQRHALPRVAVQVQQPAVMFHRADRAPAPRSCRAGAATSLCSSSSIASSRISKGGAWAA